jgi:putative transposase
MSMCGVKFRAYPTMVQANILSQWIGCARVIYNCKVAEDRQNYLRFKETGEKSPVHQAYSHFKSEDRPWLNSVPSQILRNSASNWYQAKQRFFKNLAKNPRKKHKGARDSVLLTQELFSFTPKVNQGEVSTSLTIGTKRYDVGNLKIVDHRDCGMPKQVVISKKHDRWYVSFCYETGEETPSEESIIESYATMTESELKGITVGIDRGVVIPFQVSNGVSFDYDQETKQRLEKKVRRQKRYQKRMARQQLESRRRKRTKQKVGKLHQKIANIRHNFCHQISHALADSTPLVFAVEDLSIKNMTRAPKPKKDKDGRYLPNKRKAKSGLNRELLSKGLGKTIDFLAYKALQRGKCVVYVSPYHSSQECALCSHIHPDNRKTQAKFLCLSCGYQANADFNASQVMAKRGIQYLLSKPIVKTKTRLGTSRSHARRGTCKTSEEFFSSTLVPMTLEALPL